jgi:HTH-type transcriptional regulator/antitoxin HigA
VEAMTAFNDYLKLVHKFPLVPIKNKPEHDAAIRVSLELGKKDADMTQGECDYYHVLAMLIRDYEAGHTAEREPISPQELLKFLMEEHGLKQVDVARIIGYESHVSAFLSGKRNLSKAEAITLGNYFAINATAFLPRLKQQHTNLRKGARAKGKYHKVQRAVS